MPAPKPAVDLEACARAAQKEFVYLTGIPATTVDWRAVAAAVLEAAGKGGGE
jgi:hypothetical protein